MISQAFDGFHQPWNGGRMGRLDDGIVEIRETFQKYSADAGNAKLQYQELNRDARLIEAAKVQATLTGLSCPKNRP